MNVTSVEGSEFAVKAAASVCSPLPFFQSEGFTAKYPRRYRNCVPGWSTCNLTLRNFPSHFLLLG